MDIQDYYLNLHTINEEMAKRRKQYRIVILLAVVFIVPYLIFLFK